MSREAVNKLLDESSSEQDFRDKVSDLAAQKHGKDAVNSLLESSSNEEDFISKVSDLAASEPKKTQGDTFESKYLQPVYDVGSKLSILEKLTSPIKGPIVQAATLGHPVETLKKELTRAEPQPESYMTSRLREVIPEEYNPKLMDTPVKDVAQGEKLKAALKLMIQNQAPKLYNVASEARLSDPVGMAIDEFISGKVPNIGSVALGKASEKISPYLKESASADREKVLTRISNMTGEPADEAVLRLKNKKAGNTLEEMGLANLISNPSNLHEALIGKRELDYSKSNIGSQVKKPGLIDELSSVVNNSADYFSETKAPKKASELVEDAFSRLSEKTRSPLSEIDEGVITSSLNDLLKPYNLEKGKKYNLSAFYEGGAGAPKSVDVVTGKTVKTYTLKDLINIKRDAYDFIYDIKNNPKIDPIQASSKVAAYDAIKNAADDAINTMLEGDKDAGNFLKANSDLSDLLHVRNITSGAKNAAIKAPSLTDVAIGMGVGGAIGESIGNPRLGLMAGGGLGAARGAFGGFEKTLPARFGQAKEFVAGRMAQPVSQVTKGITSGISRLPVQVEGLNENIQQDPQQAMFMGKGLVENLADYEIPRSVDAILQNKRLVLAKIAQSSNNPQVVSVLEDALNKHPDKLKEILPVLVMQFPVLFEADKYPSRIDGKILDPMDQMKAKKNLENSGKSNTEKMLILNGLHKDGSFPGDI